MRDQHGAVLPLAMLSLLVLSAVLLGLSMLSGREPLVARNHTLMAQAQAMAEAGLDRALWALSTPDAADGVPWFAPVPAPYDGSRVVGVAVGGMPLGGFRLTITGTGDRQRQVVAIGLAPGDSSPLGQARQDITATAIRLRFPSPPASITVRGDLQVAPGVVLDSAGDGSCGNQAGTWSSGTTTLGPGSQVQGPDGDTEVQQRQPVAAFDELTFGASELLALKALARARGTYYQGAVSFDARRPIPNGLIFVDTVSGRPVTEATPAADLATVSLGEGASASPGGVVRGWIVVNGSLAIGGDVVFEGLAYAGDRFSQTGAARIRGSVMAGHVRSTTPSLIEALPAGGPALTASCEAARTGGGVIQQRWIVKPGSYREAAG
jgi:hypothetical protein